MKSFELSNVTIKNLSLPTWGRGLKYLMGHLLHHIKVVAPHMGAWIEIAQRSQQWCAVSVAPHMGAWIEIVNGVVLCRINSVAPRMGAWIEI